jgi:hypothetical protein
VVPSPYEISKAKFRHGVQTRSWWQSIVMPVLRGRALVAWQVRMAASLPGAGGFAMCGPASAGLMLFEKSG